MPRSGRFNVGVWPGWWGCGGRSPMFDSVDIDIAEIKIKPYTTHVVDIPQTYDQVGMRCDISDIPESSTPNVNPDKDNNKPSLYLLFLLLLLIPIIVGIVIFYKKKVKLQKVGFEPTTSSV